jgi:hypothetical protein
MWIHLGSVNMRKHAHFGGGENPPALRYLYVLNCHWLAIFGLEDGER